VIKSYTMLVMFKHHLVAAALKKIKEVNQYTNCRLVRFQCPQREMLIT
jgi:hypothetical protein